MKFFFNLFCIFSIVLPLLNPSVATASQSAADIEILATRYGDPVDIKLDQSDGFIPMLPGESRRIGYSSEPVWAKLKITPHLTQSGLLLVIKNPLVWHSQAILDGHDLPIFSNFPFPAFEISGVGSSQLQSAPVSSSQLQSAPVSSSQPWIVFVRQKSDAALNFSFKILTQAEYLHQSQFYAAIYSFYGAIVLVFAGLFLVYYLNSKNKISLSYVLLLMIFHLCGILGIFGLPSAYLSKNWRDWGTCFIAMPECLACIAIIYFVRILIGRSYNRWDKGLSGVAFIVAILSFFLKNIYVMMASLGISLITVVTILLNFYFVRNRNKYFRYYFIALSLISTGLIVSVVEYLGWIQNYGSRLFVLGGSLGELFIIAAVLTRTLHKEHQELAVSSELIGLARQVAHDIRSPLAVLKIVEKDLDSVPLQTRSILKAAIGRMNEIAVDLLNAKKGQIGSVDLYPLLSNLIREKRIEFQDRSIQIIFTESASPLPLSSQVFARVNSTDLKRIVSNLINNSIEANAKTISVKLEITDKNVILSLIDDGKGIPSAFLSKLGTRGASFQKEGGHGLGLYHAKTQTEAWNGTMHVDSKVGEGTTFIFKFSRALE